MRTSKRIIVSDKDRVQLDRVIRNRNTPQKVALRARIVLLSADGIPTGEIMRQLSTTTPTITRWRNRYETIGMPGLLSRTGVDRDASGELRKLRCVRL